MIDLIFEAKGFSELARELTELPVRIEKNILRGMIRAAAKPVVADARAKAPRLTDFDPRRVPGALAASIRVMSTATKGALIKGGVAVGSNKRTLKTPADAFYAKWVEYGRNGMSPQPFLRPAAASATPAALEAAAAYVRDRIDAGDLKEMIQEALYAQMTGFSALSSLISTRLYFGLMPENPTYPAVTYMQAASRRETAMGANPGIVHATFQFDAYDTDPDSVRNVCEQIRKSLDRYRATNVQSVSQIFDCFPENIEGPTQSWSTACRCTAAWSKCWCSTRNKRSTARWPLRSSSTPSCGAQGFDWTGDVNALALKAGADLVDKTNFGSGGVRERLPGLKFFSFQHAGFVNYGANNVDDAIWNSRFAVKNAVMTIDPQAAGTEGDLVYTGQVDLAKLRAGREGRQDARLRRCRRRRRRAARARHADEERHGERDRQRHRLPARRDHHRAEDLRRDPRDRRPGRHQPDPRRDPAERARLQLRGPPRASPSAQMTARGAQWGTALAGSVTDTWWRFRWTIGGTAGPSFPLVAVAGIITP
jgi:HK97 gp10 family phage protein